MLKAKASMAFILATMLLDSISLGLVNPILPRLIQVLTGRGPSEVGHLYGLLVASNSAMLFLAAPVIGRISDRFGRRPVIMIALSGMAVNFLAAAAADSLLLLFVAQMIAGTCGANLSTAAAYTADVSPPEKQAQNFGLLSAVFSSGFVIGPPLGGLLAEISPRAPFLAAAGLVAISVVFGLFVLPESLPPERRRAFSLKGLLPFAALMRLPIGTTIRALAAVLFFFQLGRVMAQSNWVLFMQYRFGWSASEVGLSLGLWGVVSLVSLGWLPRILLPRVGELRAILGGLLIIMTSCVFYGSATQGWMIYVVVIVSSLGFTAQPAIQAMISRQVAADRQGEIQGALTSLSGLGLIIGPFMANVSFGYFNGPAAPVQIPGVAFYLAAVAIGVGVIVAAITLLRGTKLGAAPALAPSPDPSRPT
jgi:DHA1 family tetracycline resistance protein-like MFS transporter